MRTFTLKNGFSRAGANGTQRFVWIGLIGAGFLALIGLVWSQSPKQTAPSTIAVAPKVDPLPGGPKTTPAYTGLAVAYDKGVSDKATATGRSSTATMPGKDGFRPVTADALEQPAQPAPQVQETGTTPVTRAAAMPAITTTTTRAANPPVGTQTTVAQQSPKPDENQSKAYAAAINGLLAGWGSKPQATEVVLRPEDEKAASTVRQPGGLANGQGSDAVQNAGTQPIPNARTLGGRDTRQVLMPAGRGVYARTVLAASSDQGGPVVVEALSGPIAGDRMTGSFERREERLVVKLNSITLQDGTQQSIDALVIAPDTMETSVASNVDQHYTSRFVLPVAAAFVAGLGQAFAQSNQTVVAGPLGGATAFQRLNLGQQLGVGAGVAGAQLSAILHDAAPKGPTVTLDANVNVGVVFLAPVVVGGR